MDRRALFVGLVCVDIIAETDGFPIEDTDQRISKLCHRRGGNAANSSCVLAQLGVKTEFLGTLGQCSDLCFILEDFIEHGVSYENCPVQQGQQFSTSMVIINCQSGTRTILHHPKKMPELQPEYLKSLDLQNYSWIHFEGRSENVEQIKDMIEYTRQSHPEIRISVEIEKPRPVLKELIPFGDVLFVSKDFSKFAGYHSMEKAARGFLERTKAGTIVVCPWGAHGAAVGQNGNFVVETAKPPDEIVDSLGAGDTFNAAFIYSQIKGFKLDKSLEFSCSIAGFKIGQRGFRAIGKYKDTLVHDLLDTLPEDERYPDGAVRLRNPNIELMDQDILYHLALGSGSHDLHQMFGDVKFICMGGTPKRMEQFAYFIMDEIGHKMPAGTTLLDISQYSYRYSMYKVGPVLSISHGMGIPSVGILLHEIIKLMYHARVKDPVFFRLGTCGGIGIEGGQLVITEEAVDGQMRPFLELPVLGKLVQRPAKLDSDLARELASLTTEDDPFETHVGRTMCTYDFYEGQGRLDGAFCDYTEKEKLDFLNTLHEANIKNMEMESLAFAALTHHAGVRAAVICVTLLNRLNGDQVASSKEVLNEWQNRPQNLVARYIKKHLGMSGPVPRPPPPGPKTVMMVAE